MDLTDKYRGCLLGVAIGDCLGTDGAAEGVLSGVSAEAEGSDDLAMTLCLARAIVEAGGYERDSVVEEYLRWFQSAPAGIGRSTYLSLSLIAIGESPEAASEQAHVATGELSAGNGVAMRCSPIALRYRGRSGPIADVTCIDGRITHYDPLAGLGAAAVGLVIDSMLAGDLSRTEAVLASAAAIGRRGGDRPASDASRKVAATLHRVVERGASGVHPTGYVLDTIHAALAAFLGADDFESCLLGAVGFGGDSDTIGAVAGSMAGACWGAGAIPDRWSAKAARRETIITLADELHELAQDG